MDANTTLALAVAGVATPWIVEVIKNVLGDIHGRWSLTITLISSLVISLGVLAYNGALQLSDPAQILGSVAMVAGVAMTVYQYIKKAVTEPVKKVMTSVKMMLV